ncbi:hypothetical protein MPUL_16550 [Mycolicibacterium pulveris]|uniref:Uncharacterized protein n=1 Tax=Mycolicibacterium pulveris TaxID=36813 RepID=A0A7I7UGW8_MYCPV|nr:hypothetical protein MPUL_16550 [Mycolicibacterium pulveris]
MLDLVEIARRDLQHLRERGLAQSAFGPELTDPRTDECLGHVTHLNLAVKAAFASLAGTRLWEDLAVGTQERNTHGG